MSPLSSSLKEEKNNNYRAGAQGVWLGTQLLYINAILWDRQGVLQVNGVTKMSSFQQLRPERGLSPQEEHDPEGS